MRDNQTILIVEDEYIIREDLKRMVYSFGYETVVTAADRASAMDWFLRVNPDIILLDISLRNGVWRGMNEGLLIAEEVRNHNMTPIIFVTALNDSETINRASNLPFIHFITKPLTETQLKATLTLASINEPNQTIRNHTSNRDRVFISYSHIDRKYLTSLQAHLKSLRREGIDIWDDTRLSPGSNWREEIREQIGRCRIAILLVSAEFLASDFIVENELLPLLEAAANDGAVILHVPLRPCNMPERLTRFQTLSGLGPKKALSELKPSARDRAWMELANQINEGF